MKVQVRCGSGSVVAEGETHADLWEQLAQLQEAFGESICGKCHKSNLRHVVRTNDDGDKFYELHCQDCRARLRMSQVKKGGNFYPRRKAVENDSSGLAQGEWLPNRGWMKYDHDTKKEV